jgi:transcriptional regulator with XRE-family HTH domain
MKRNSEAIEKLSRQIAEVDPAFAHLNEKASFVMQLLPLREEAGLTQEDMAEKMGAPVSRVAKIERQPHKVPLEQIADYARVLGARFELVVPEKKKKRA